MQIKGKRVLVVEDGPTLTHGNMAFGAGMVAARGYGVGEVVRPQPFLPKGGNLEKVFAEFPQVSAVRVNG
jgi:predicted GTPase